MREGVDYSATPPTAEAMAAAGRDFVLRYARKTGYLDKQVTAAEAAYWRAHGVDIAIVDEVSTERALGGWSAGVTDATAARAAVLAAGGPADSAIYTAVDFAPTAAQMPTVTQYVKGAASVLGWARTGVYGGLNAIRAVLDADACRLGWQTYAWSSYKDSAGSVVHTPRPTDQVVGNTVWDSRCQLQQYRNGVQLGGVQVDLDRATADDFGQWDYNQGDDMWTPEAQVKALLDAAAAGQLDPFFTRQNQMAAKYGFARTVDVSAAAKDVKSLVEVLRAELGEDEATLLGALSALQLSLSPDQVAQLAAALDLDEQAVADAVRRDFAARLAEPSVPA